MKKEGRQIVVLSAVFLITCIAIVFAESGTDVVISYEENLFQSFIKKYNRPYSNGSLEYTQRFEIFKGSLKKHDLLNAARSHPDHAIYGITKFSDLTKEEFTALHLGHVKTWPQSRQRNIFLQSSSSIPSKMDLRTRKPSVVTAVRNQKTCGACWAFSVAEIIETDVAMKTKQLTPLSVQELVDCGTAAGDSGCHGGIPCRTLEWLNRTKTRLVPEAGYPYKAQKENCRVLTNSSQNAVVADFTCGNYTTNEIDAMPSLLYKHGSVSVSVDAESWQYYLGGIIQYHCTPNYLNHAVQIVGYDKTGDIPFYIVRNSWGADWGVSGYLRIKIGDNVCGIASAVQTVMT